VPDNAITSPHIRQLPYSSPNRGVLAQRCGQAALTNRLGTVGVQDMNVGGAVGALVVDHANEERPVVPEPTRPLIAHRLDSGDYVRAWPQVGRARCLLKPSRSPSRSPTSTSL